MKALAYQWMPGAYSHAAALQVAEKYAIDPSAITWYDHFDDVRSRISDEVYGVLPIENSYAGTIHINMYRFLSYPYTVRDDVFLPINHCLLATHTSMDLLEEVHSHPQALEQCYRFCQENALRQIVSHDTAGAAKRIVQQNDPTKAAIASSLAAELYGLQIVQSTIQDNDQNTTRFFLVGPSRPALQWPKKNRIIVLFSFRDGQGMLYKCLWSFATNGINLTKIESLPSRQDPFTYFFRLECEGSLDDRKLKAALEELSFFAGEVRVLGAW